ncbi:fungal specific transcription factor domain-containing protein [Trichoderma breve]|uniref:Fungal specific transcription factor domain-containing protein n=1 Tax=Trichoderma breve TaxID=2034170 RepID=A0A9W9B4L0_9HYPO|nr:fungal specific transcription factor domain-containing protein [Trichoderma breve]KAJ4856060.1 fungal specific transcription factor domain-containing protein [Trichoderma breve]
MKRKPRRPAGFKYIAQLEKRLLGVEALLGERSLGKPTVPNIISHKDQTTAATLPDTAALIKSHNESNSWMPENELQVPSFEHTNNPVEFRHGATFRVPDHDATDWSTLGSYVTDRMWPRSAPESRLVALPARQQLPTKAVAEELIEETFSNYNRFLPLFHEEDFLREFHLKYSTSSPRDAGWWACLNVVLSIAHRLRAIRTLDPTQEHILAYGYAQNALSVVSELNVSDRSLSAVQALAGMACLLQGTPDPEPAAMLVAAALRLAQLMNLHRECSSPGVTESEAEKRRRVFWKVYILDKDVSLRTGRPFGQDDDDMDVLLPSKASLESGNLDLFNCRIGLALVQGQVYKQLYSVRAGRQTAAQRAIAAQELSSLLSYWKSSAQLEILEDFAALPGFQLSGEMIHKVVLRLTYLHCLTMIDRHLPLAAKPFSNQELSRSEPMSPPGSLCVAEARKAIRLIEAIPQGDCACVWMLLHAFFAAASSMLHNLTHNPISPNAISDLNLIEPFLRLLETLAKDPNTISQSKELVQMHRTCKSLNLKAKKAVQHFSSKPLASFT